MVFPCQMNGSPIPRIGRDDCWRLEEYEKGLKVPTKGCTWDALAMHENVDCMMPQYDITGQKLFFASLTQHFTISDLLVIYDARLYGLMYSFGGDRRATLQLPLISPESLKLDAQWVMQSIQGKILLLH